MNDGKSATDQTSHGPQITAGETVYLVDDIWLAWLTGEPKSLSVSLYKIMSEAVYAAIWADMPKEPFRAHAITRSALEKFMQMKFAYKGAGEAPWNDKYFKDDGISWDGRK